MSATPSVAPRTVAPTSILVVDDQPGVVQAASLLFKEEGWRTVGLESPERVDAFAELEAVDLVLLDMNFERDTTSGGEGIDALQRLAARVPDVPVVLMTAWGTVDRAVEAMKVGAADYLTKPWDDERLVATCRTHIELSKAKRTNRMLAEQNRLLRAELDARHDFSRIVGESPQMMDVLRLVAEVAPTQASVLVTGPPGTGKELVAHALHANSPRKAGPLVKVHLGALPESLFERELFGHVKGAFTDARDDVPGRFAVADGGTLFLDEVGTLPASQQVKLLRVLQEGEFEPLGSTRTQKVDVRVVAATNVDLRAEIAAGRFREDLYYRLNVMEIRLPALSERAGDIPLLARAFIEEVAPRNGKSPSSFSADAVRVLQRYAWPGNVRELKNVIERAVILSRGNEIGVDELPGLAAAPARPASEAMAALSHFTLADLERALIGRVLEENGGNVVRAAQALGLSRSALYRRLEKFGLTTPNGEPDAGTPNDGKDDDEHASETTR